MLREDSENFWEACRSDSQFLLSAQHYFSAGRDGQRTGCGDISVDELVQCLALRMRSPSGIQHDQVKALAGRCEQTDHQLVLQLMCSCCLRPGQDGGLA